MQGDGIDGKGEEGEAEAISALSHTDRFPAASEGCTVTCLCSVFHFTVMSLLLDWLFLLLLSSQQGSERAAGCHLQTDEGKK